MTLLAAEDIVHHLLDYKLPGGPHRPPGPPAGGRRVRAEPVTCPVTSDITGREPGPQMRPWRIPSATAWARLRAPRLSWTSRITLLIVRSE